MAAECNDEMEIEGSSSYFDAALSAVSSAAKNCSATKLQPRAFFIAWNGVLCLMYTGFPPSLVTMKETLNDDGENLGLKKEGFGSKWPKTTVGVFAENSSPPLLDEEQLVALRALCESHSEGLVGLGGIIVTAASTVQYQQRGLERCVRRVDVPLVTSEEPSKDDPSMSERERVESVYSEWSDARTYLPRVNERGLPYREGSPEGYTCVLFLDLEESIASQVREFRCAVDRLLPGKYVWLEESSLHCTIRSLDPDPNLEVRHK